MPGCRLTITVPDPEQELALLLCVSTAMALLKRELPEVTISVSEVGGAVDAPE